ncbi:hypothetical protein [Desulfosarcina cetonica]|uniref:hypothetical protein n=1 Tax=Desulfosarcina cetonica TaxID=90730 RepID=UPI0006D0D204|nr:hypothetical protein [Desulfosarcina cetonica]
MRNIQKRVQWAGLLVVSALLTSCFFGAVTGKTKTMRIDAHTPAPTRFVVRDGVLVDLRQAGQAVFFRGMGYSPYHPGETPLYGDPPGNDGRYARDLAIMQAMGVNYLHVFPQRMPANFFTALDETGMAYGQDVWIWPYQGDLLDPAYQAKTLADIRMVIDHTYTTGRPDRLVLFSIGDELQASSVIQTDAAHPLVRDYHGKHLTLTRRTPSEIAMAMLVDGAMDYELARYGRRHLYCHTSWTHIGPLADRPDLEVEQKSVLVPTWGI